MSSNPNDDPRSSRTGLITNSWSRTPRGRTILKLLGALICVIAIFACYACFVPSPRVARGILTATADHHQSDGYRQVGEVSEKAALSASASTLQATCSVSTGSSSSSSSGSRFFGRTLAIYNKDDHLLMKRIGLDVFETLRSQGRFDTLHYLPFGQRLPDGQLLPELFVTLDLNAWTEQGFPGRTTYDGELVVTAGNEYQSSSHHYSSNSTPPQVNFRTLSTIDYHAVQTGFETSGARYQSVSCDLAKEIVERLSKLFDDMAEKHATPTKLPDAFYPAYIPPPEFDFVEKLKAEKVVDGHQLMSPTEVAWKLPAGVSPQDTIAIVKKSLTDSGWDFSNDDSNDGYLRATQGDEVLGVFHQDDGQLSESADSGKQPTVYITYHRSMSEESVTAAVKNLVLSGANESALVMFQQQWYRYPELIDGYFDQHHPTQPDSWLQLARLHKTSNPEAAKQAILKATALRRIITQQSPDSSMKKLAEELGMNELPNQISASTISALGLRQLTSPGELELTILDYEQAIVYLGEYENRQKWILLTPVLKSASAASRQLSIQVVELSEGGSSRMHHTTGDLSKQPEQFHAARLDNDTLELKSDLGSDAGTYRIKLRRIAN